MDELIVILLILLVVTPFICMIVTLVTASRVSATIRDAEHRWRKRLAGMEQPTKTGQPPAVVAPPPRPPVSSAASVPPPVRKREPMEPKKVEAEERPLETPASVFPPPSQKPKEPARELEKPAAPASVPVVARAKSDVPALSLEERIGGRWFNWVGILAMLFGVAYGLKYSFDEGWVTPTMRFWGGLTLGVALLAAGVVSERRGYAVLARGFWGGGTGTLFLVFYAGFQLLTGPEGAPVIARGVAFVGMALTVVVGGSIAVVYNARSTAVLSAVGGYLTPLLLGNFARDQVFLFTYLSILTAGLLVLGYWKRWVFLRPLAFEALMASMLTLPGRGALVEDSFGAPITAHLENLALRLDDLVTVDPLSEPLPLTEISLSFDEALRLGSLFQESLGAAVSGATSDTSLALVDFDDRRHRRGPGWSSRHL